MGKTILMLCDRLFMVGLPLWLFPAVMVLLAAWMCFLLYRGEEKMKQGDQFLKNRIRVGEPAGPLSGELVMYLVYSRIKENSDVKIILADGKFLLQNIKADPDILYQMLQTKSIFFFFLS